MTRDDYLELISILIGFAIGLFLIFNTDIAKAMDGDNVEDVDASKIQQVYVTCKYLNVRGGPGKSYDLADVHFEKGDCIEITGQTERGWYRLNITNRTYFTNTGEFWVKGDYISELMEESLWRNTSGGRVWIRYSPEGKIMGAVKADRRVKVTRVINGYGYLENGYCINLTYFTRIETNE